MAEGSNPKKHNCFVPSSLTEARAHYKRSEEILQQHYGYGLRPRVRYFYDASKFEPVPYDKGWKYNKVTNDNWKVYGKQRMLRLYPSTATKPTFVRDLLPSFEHYYPDKIEQPSPSSSPPLPAKPKPPKKKLPIKKKTKKKQKSIYD